MKLHEIKRTAPVDEDGFLIEEQDIRKAVAMLKIASDKFHVNQNGTVDVIGDVNIDGKRIRAENEMRQLPIRFGMVQGNFILNNHALTNFKGCPRHVGGEFKVSNNAITSLAGLPETAKSITIWEPLLTSLVGINDQVKKCESFNCYFDSALGEITEGGIGLLYIDNLKSLLGFNKFANKSPWVIIAKYVGRPEDIFDCQSELIENGFEAFAQP